MGPAHTKKTIFRFGSAETVFHAGDQTLSRNGVPRRLIAGIRAFVDFPKIEEELALLEKEGIRPLFFTDEDYPTRLLPFKNMPPILYFKGHADLNAGRTLAVIGTRAPSDYGLEITEKIIREIASPGLLIVSGLAFGIDAAAHKAALRRGIPTVGVMGHGLAHIYPPSHASLARNMTGMGGLLSDYSHHTKPEIHQFPARNRIIAALGDALLVVETDLEGGSLITAGKALEFGKKIFAVPGRLTDSRSSGANQLIASGHARLLREGGQLLQDLGWPLPGDSPVGAGGSLTSFSNSPAFPSTPPSVSQTSSDVSQTSGKSVQGHLFFDAVEPGNANQGLLRLIREYGPLSLDEIGQRSRLDGKSVAMVLLRLELDGLIRCLPGSIYQACA
jgi:DNA processing protein